MAEKIEAAVEDSQVPTAASPVEELAIFGPEPEELQLSIGPTMVAPMKMGQIRKMMELASDLFPAIIMMAEELKATGEISVAALGEIAGSRFFEIIGIACKRKASELDELEPDEFVTLVAKILVVNMDFFGQRLPTVLAQAKVSVGKAAEKTGVGRMLSKNLSGMGTASKTSVSTPTASS